MYSITIARQAVKSLEKLPQKDKEKIKLAIASLSVNPFSGKKLQGEYKDFYSLRAWPYRIIYQVNKKRLMVFVIEIGHRQGVY